MVNYFSLVATIHSLCSMAQQKQKGTKNGKRERKSAHSLKRSILFKNGDSNILFIYLFIYLAWSNWSEKLKNDIKVSVVLKLVELLVKTWKNIVLINQ